MKQAVGAAEDVGEWWRRQAETAAERVAVLEAQLAALEGARAQAELMGEQYRQKADAAATQAHDLLAELVDVTSELLEMRRGSSRRS